MTLLSDRIKRIKPSPTIAIDTKAKQMIADGIDVISFGAGEPDFDTPDPIKEAAVQALKAGKTKYTAVGGINELKDAIIAKFKRDNGLSYSRDEVLVSVGGKHSLYNAFQALLNPSDEVIIPSPYWVSYPDQVLLCDGTPVILPTEERNGFCLRPEVLEKAITKKTRIFVLNSPSNPTGGAYPRKKLEEIAEVLTQHEILCLSDEIYEKIVYNGFQFVSIASLHEKMKGLTITVNGASKVYSMTGWRMGYAAGPKDIIQAMTKFQGQVTTNINSATQWACVAALNGPQDFLREWVGEFKKRRDYMVSFFNKIPGISCFNPQGAFYVFPNISAYFGKRYDDKAIRGSDDLAEYLLIKSRVAVVPGTGFGAEGYIRLSYATSMEKIQKGLERIEKAFEELV
ncbi:MAG: pyridoxal phosphate-dependent aminotransferase [Deltaproteobacteria bacterium]|nr:pyridoxal phosphate-dependent aminotransferase [Deltaproteobacteria bacterium]MBI4196447.1 pyridoxal phosphate-dependent aminotransferase [Deltaproteobacteria bacterium]